MPIAMIALLGFIISNADVVSLLRHVVDPLAVCLLGTLEPQRLKVERPIGPYGPVPCSRLLLIRGSKLDIDEEMDVRLAEV